MNRTILQVPLSVDLKKSAEKQAIAQGFSSLQEAVRLFLNKFASAAFTISFQEEKVVKLSKKNEKRYLKMLEDIKQGRNFTTTKNLQELFKKLS